MALIYNKAIRDLSIKGVITLASDDPTNVVQINLLAEDVLNYSGNGTIGTEGLPLGSAEAASYTLTIDNTYKDENGNPASKKYSPEIFDNAEVHMFTGIAGEDGLIVYDDCGVWYVNGSYAPEQGVEITLNGYDSLASRFEATFEDAKENYPTTIGQLAQRSCTAARIALKTSAFPNSTVEVSKLPEWEDNTTLRHVLSYCAIAAGGFVRMSRDGQVEIVSFSQGTNYALSPDLYHTFSSTGGSKFSFNAIEAMLKADSDDYSRFAVDSDIDDNATNTIQIDYNPLLSKALIQSVVDLLKDADLTFEAGTITWGGDPIVMCGDIFTVTDLGGKSHKIIVTQQSFQFDGGLRFTETCALPSINTVNSATFSTSTNMYDANGNLRVTHIAGFGRSVINAMVGHIGQLTSDNITTDTLSANLISALNLMVGLIDAKVLKANSITADQIAAGAVTAEKISADAIDTVALEAVIAKIESLTAADIETDRLAAALAAFTVITAGTASFDQATIQHLVAQALNLSFGTFGEVFIDNLRVKYAQMVSATIGNLCIKASDGNYYTIDVDENGNVSATLATVTEGEITAGQTDGGRVILETNITAASLNTSNLLATYALINKIDAARIDVAELFANKAFISALTTSLIYSDTSLQMIIGAQNEMNRWFTFDDEAGFSIQKPAYTDAEGVAHAASIWRFVATETGIQVRRNDMLDPVLQAERDRIATPNLQIGEIVCKKTSSGGWVWTDA